MIIWASARSRLPIGEIIELLAQVLAAGVGCASVSAAPVFLVALAPPPAGGGASCGTTTSSICRCSLARRRRRVSGFSSRNGLAVERLFHLLGELERGHLEEPQCLLDLRREGQVLPQP